MKRILVSTIGLSVLLPILIWDLKPDRIHSIKKENPINLDAVNNDEILLIALFAIVATGLLALALYKIKRENLITTADNALFISGF